MLLDVPPPQDRPAIEVHADVDVPVAFGQRLVVDGGVRVDALDDTGLVLRLDVFGGP